MYTHFGMRSFREDGRLNPRFVKLMERLAAKGGWFVPVSEVLDLPAGTPARRHLHQEVVVRQGQLDSPMRLGREPYRAPFPNNTDQGVRANTYMSIQIDQLRM